MFTLRRPLIRLTTPAALALLISGASLMMMPKASAAGFQRIDRPVYQSRPAHIKHSRTVQCQINNPSMYCYHSRGDLDLASRNTRWFPMSFKFIHYSMRAYTQIHNNNQVKVTVRYRSYEGGGDHTTFWSTRNYIVYTAPSRISHLQCSRAQWIRKVCPVGQALRPDAERPFVDDQTLGLYGHQDPWR